MSKLVDIAIEIMVYAMAAIYYAVLWWLVKN